MKIFEIKNLDCSKKEHRQKLVKETMKVCKLDEKQTIDQIVDSIMELEEGTKIQILAPIVRGKKGEFIKVNGQWEQIDKKLIKINNKWYDIEKIKLKTEGGWKEWLKP